MSGFLGQVALPDWTRTNQLFNNDALQIRHNDALTSDYAPNAASQQLQLGAEQLKGAQLTNTLNATLIPQKMNMINSLMSDGGGSQASPTPNMPSSSLSTPSDSQSERSMLQGAMPVSADSQTQQRVGQVAQSLGVNPEWAMRVQHAETGGYSNSMGAVSPAGAKGTMQLMDGTAKELGVDSSNAEGNIHGGVKYLAQMKQKYRDPVIATAAYNAGPGRVDSWLSGKQALPAETTKYVGHVFGGDGAGLLNNVFSGAHGHPVAGVQVADNSGTMGALPQQGNGAPQPGGGGMEPVQLDDGARTAVRKLSLMRDLASVSGDMRAAAQFTAQLDNIAGPGGVVDGRTGNVMRVPGSFSTRYYAAQASKAGEVAPATQLAQNQAGIAQQTHAANTGVDVQAAAAKEANQTRELGNRPLAVAPNSTIVIPNTVLPSAPGYTGAAQPPQADSGALQSFPSSSSPSPMDAVTQASKELAPTLNGMAPDAANAAVQARAQQILSGGLLPPSGRQADGITANAPGLFHVPSDAGQKAAEMEAERSVKNQDEVITQAKESTNALNRLQQARAAMHAATANGLPPGFFSPALAEGAAAAKSLGIDLSSLGINPGAVQNEQVAREALTQINGEILKRMFPQRITNADVTTFGRNLANYGMDPSALEPIMNMAEKAAQYDTNKAGDMMAYKQAHKNSVVGWDTGFYQKHGYGPDLFDAIKSGTVPGGATLQSAQSSSASTQSYTRENPATPRSVADVQALPSGAYFMNPKDGKTLVKH